MEAIATFIKATKATPSSSATVFDIQSEAEVPKLKPEEIAALSKEELEQLALRSQNVLDRCPIKPGCRFVQFCLEMYFPVPDSEIMIGEAKG